jgi:large subunit ribosomal protein L21
MKYAIILSGNKQYKVQEGDTIVVERLNVEPDSAYAFEKVLLFVEDGNVQLGKPTLADVSVSAKILQEIKGKKIRVAKFKAKSRYRRVTGFRALQTTLLIEKITPKTSKEK